MDKNAVNAIAIAALLAGGAIAVKARSYEKDKRGIGYALIAFSAGIGVAYIAGRK